MFIEVMIFLLEWSFLRWVFFTLFLWLFSCILKAVSAFPTYCFLHNLHTIKYITNMMQKINFVKNVFWVCWLLKVDVVVIWLQHRVLLFQKHGKHFPGFKVLLFIFFTMLFSILLLPMWSLRFLLSLKAATGLFWKVFFEGFVNRQYIPIFPHNFTDVW